MMVSNKGTFRGLLEWQRANVLVFLIPAVVVTIWHEGTSLLHLISGWEKVTLALPPVLPALPLAVVGGAVGIFVSFRTNSAYDRWWEGRKLWGRLINQSRHWTSQVLVYVPDEADQQRLVRRHIAYVHLLRLLLREQDPREDAELKTYLRDGELDAITASSNGTHHLLLTQLREVTALSNEHHVDAFRLQGLDATLRQFLDIQGGCERIKKTPLPRGYGFIAEQLIRVYGILLPFALVESAGWATIPLNVLVCLAFMLISEAGRVLEDPFTLFWNALPLSALSNTIERNLLHAMGETEVPAPTPVSEDGILM